MLKSSRRQFLAGSLALPLLGRGPSYSEQMPDMLLTYLAAKMNALAARWDEERAKIKTAAALEARNSFVREKFRQMIHGLPERSALTPVVVRIHERDGYRIENVMFQSRPNFWVTGNLYVPTSGKGPFPAVISPCGHYALARMDPEYQFAYLNMVKAGFVVLAYDPIGQGERRQYWNPETGTADIPDPVYEHSMPGQALLLMGQDLTHYRVWDGMRAIDYLETRSEVDPRRIACAGHSGGGTLTLFISALDERIKCAVVNEGGTTHRWPLEIRPETRIGPSDVEQNFFPAAVYGIDLCDLHVAIAPRPLLALIEDYSPRFNLAAGHILTRYQQFGVPEKFGTEVATDPHSWTMKLRIASTDWLSRWLYDRPGPTSEPEFEPEKPETLHCTPNGSLRYSGRGDTIFSILAKEQQRLPPAPKSPASAAAIREIIRYRKSDTPLAPRLLGSTPRKGYKVEKLEFLSEPGIYIPAWVFLPDGLAGPKQPTLYVNEAGKEAEGREFGLYERLARKGELVIAMDVRGIGATRPPHSPPGERRNEFTHLFDVETAMTYYTWYMDESLFGMRVADVIRGVDYALSRADVSKEGVRVAGQGAGALWALYAAALDPRITSVVAERGLVSYRALAQTDRYTHSAGIFVRDVLKHFDLPQVAAAIAPRPLTLVSPVDAMKRTVDAARAGEIYESTASAYRSAGAAASFRIKDQLWDKL
jgi:cephalosporin-C deacetylase-like acetyl esterase